MLDRCLKNKLLTLVIIGFIQGSNVSALKSQLLRNAGYSRGLDIGYKESMSPGDVVAPRVKIGKQDEALLEIGKFATISINKNSSPVSHTRRSQRPKRHSNDRVVDAATTFTCSNESKSSLLSKQEEREFANQIRMLRTVVRIRDEIISTHNSQIKIWQQNSWQPTEGQWAKACGLSISELRRVIVEGKNARSQMVAANGGLVGSNAKWYLNSVTKATQAHGGVGTILSFHDLVQEGNLGLMEAAERFEPERGFRFSTYATWWVRQRMLRAISDYSRTIRLPAHVHSMIRKIQRARRDMEKEFGRPPSTKELAEHLGISAQKLHHYCSSSRSVLSLENPVRGNSRKQEEKSITLGEFISSDAPTPDEDAESRSLRETMMSVVDELPRIEKEVLLARFGLVDGDSKSVDEIAKKLGISRDRVRISEARALNKLRHPQWNHRLKSYVGGDTEDEVFSLALSPEQIWSF